MQLVQWLIAVLSGAFACWLVIALASWVLTVIEIGESLGRLPNEPRRKWLARSAATVVGWLIMLAGGVLVTIPLTNRKLNLSFGWSDALLVAGGGAVVVAGVKITQLWNGRKN